VQSSNLTVGSAAVDLVRALRADICLVGACGVHDEFGLSINDAEEASLQRAFVEASGNVIALVTLDKLQTAAPFRVSSAAAITRIITCAQVPADVTDRYRRMGIALDLA
jgi:DeoR/GlpR family transcriptional regulator of sugar metabolism